VYKFLNKKIKTFQSGKRNNTQAVTKATVFQAASISKFVTSLIIQKLVSSGKIKFTDDANKYLNSEIKDKKGTIKEVTIQQLLNHTGGISCSGFRGYSRKERIPTLNQILQGKPPANSEKIYVKYKIGTYHYSGGGFTLLQQIIQNITGKKFEDVAKKILPFKKTKNFASGYEGNKKILGDFYIYPEKAAAGLWTNAENLAKLLVRTRLNKRMLTKIRTDRDNYAGLGLFFTKDAWEHTGKNMGFKSKFIMDFKGNGIVILTNSSSGKFIDTLLK